MTYYELVSFLHSIIDTPIEYKNIEFLNNAKIELEDERYQRFLDQMALVITERITNAIKNIKEKMLTDYLDNDTLALETSMLKNEFNYCESLCKCLLVKPENQDEFISSIVDTNNALVDSLLNLFDDDERKEIIKSLYMKEEIK